jgi:phosphoadenosine phosphosulfate reductase
LKKRQLLEIEIKTDMYSYTWDSETGGLLLNSSPLQFSKEPRPVYYQELDILGFDKYWNYAKDDSAPYMWAEANNYYYRGKLVAQTKGGSFFTAPHIILIDDPEPGNGPLQRVDVESMLLKNQEIMEGLIAETIKKVYNTYLEHRDKVDIFHVSFSGGKDSEVTLDIVQRALPHNDFVVVFGDTGMEFPDTYAMVEDAKIKCAQMGISFYVAKSHMKPADSWRMFGPPTSTIRWCCSVHKTTPQLLLIKDILKKDNFTEMAFVGVRADESVRRSGYDYVSYGMKHRGQWSCNPILQWNSAEVYLYIYMNGLRLNSAYKRGNTRAGCLVCPMSTNRNDFLNYRCYPEQTKALTDIIFELNTSEQKNSDKQVSYVENNGWKARKNGRDISISPKDYDESIVGSNLVITFKNIGNNYIQWLKTLGSVIYNEDCSRIVIDSHGSSHELSVSYLDNDYIRVIISNESTASNIIFLKNIRKIFRKCHYCVGCKVCEANCKFGNLSFDERGNVSIKDTCKHCGQCLDIDTGCFVYKSLWLSKGLGNMNKSKSLDCYAAHAPKIEWFQQYVKLGERFKTEHTLGNNQIPMFNRFLRDSGIIDGDIETQLGRLLRESNLDDLSVWAIMLVNLSYTPEVGWFISTFDFHTTISQNEIVNKLSEIDTVSSSALKSIPSALKRISQLPLAEVGFGSSIKAAKEFGGTCFNRIPWQEPDPKVILYSLYKFAETCGSYYQFTLSSLLDIDVDRDGISPSQIFGFDRDSMTSILKGLSINYPDYISVSFTHDLDSITLREEKSSGDILNLF